MSLSHSNPDQIVPSGGDNPAEILLIGPDRLNEAVGQLTGAHSDVAHARRFIKFASEQGISLDHFWGFLNDQDRIVHSMLCVPSPGRTCMVFAASPSDRTGVERLGRLAAHACVSLVEKDIDLVQALLDPGELRLRNAYQSASFIELAMLSYLERALPTRRQTRPPVWPTQVTVVSYEESRHDEMLDLLDASYQDTLDCPGLCGLRRTEDILKGHQATGEFDASLWSLLHIEGRTCGAILLNPSPASGAVELVYMGLAPSARGRGLGTQLLRHGLNQLVGRAENHVTLAVDEINTPALALYRREGFTKVLRRRAMIRSLRADAPAG